jgi:YebC/PmpR family DNA-binding regulatory protein
VSGHSKWANIKRKKAKVDEAKGATFSRLTKDIASAARQGGGNPDTNFKLRLAVARAKEQNVPTANIERAIQRATGQMPGVTYEEGIYEGYGPGGTALLLEILTDNRNRTAGEVRHLFTRHGGALSESGSVQWMFEQKGRLVVPAAGAPDEDALLMAVLDAGGEDLAPDDDEWEVLTAPDQLDAVHRALEAAGIPIDKAELVRVPTSTVAVEGADAERLLRLMDLLDEHDDVQRVYTNAVFPDDEGDEG